jgi:MarC family membrane protein
MTTFLLAFTALFSIVNPLSGAFIFFGATRDLDPKIRKHVARWVSIYAFSIVAMSLYIGAYVLGFFGVSIPVLRVAGGVIVAAAGWRMLNAPDATEQRRSETPNPRTMDVPPSRLAFYPLTMPLTTGPGTISVAISLGAGRHRAARRHHLSLLSTLSPPRGLHRSDGHHHRRAPVRVPAVLHRHPSFVERGLRTAEYRDLIGKSGESGSGAELRIARNEAADPVKDAAGHSRAR